MRLINVIKQMMRPLPWVRLAMVLLGVQGLVLGMGGQAQAHTIVSKTNVTPNITVGGIATYQVTVGSAGQSADSCFMRVVDTLPPGFAYRSTQSIQFLNGSRFAAVPCNGASPILPGYTGPFFPSVGDTSPTWGRFDNVLATGASFTITFDADVINPTCTNSVTNTAVVPGDPAPTNQHAVLTPAINQAPLNITGPTANITVTKTTSTPAVINTGAAGMQATYTITVSNSISKCAATGVNIADALPAGFTYASTGAITFTGSPASAARSGGVDPVVGAANPSWTGFTIPGGGSVTLTFTANIAAGTVNGTYNNSTNAIPAESGAIVNNFGPGAPVTLSSASLTKAFGVANAQIGVPTSLTFTITKLAGAALSGVNFTDNLPSGLVVSGAPATPQCGGTVSGAGGTITITAASVATAATSCAISVNVVSATAGTYTNTSSNISAVGPPALITAGLNATLNVSNATLTKALLTPVIGVNGTSVLRFTLTNATAGVAHGGLGFTDTLPANVSVVAGFTVSQCNGGTVASSGPQNISLSGASLAAGSTTCTVDVTVQSAVPGSYVNTSTNISGLTGGLTAATVNATLAVRGTILEKNFTPVSIGVGSSSILTFTVSNGAGNPAQTGLAFTETLPTNVTLSAIPATPQCGGTVSGAVGGSTITFSGGSLALGASACTLSATVTSTVAGSYVNDSSRITAASSGMDITGVSATLVVANVVLTKQFANSPVNASTPVALVFTFTNSAGNPAQAGLAFTDTFPVGVVLSNNTATFSAGCSGTVTNLGGGALAVNDTGIKLSVGAMAVGRASCTLTVNVQAAAGGTYLNNTANISGASAGLGTSGVNATLQINGATLLVTKTTSTPVVNIIGAASGLATYTVTVQNTGFATAVGVQVTDTLPSAFTYASTPTISLGGAATRTAVVNPTAGSATPAWGTFSIPAGDSVAITFNATIPNAQASGTYNNSASVTSTTAGTVSQNYIGANSTAEDVTIQRAPDLTITKVQVTPNPVLAGQTGVQYTLAVSNIGGGAKTAGNTVTVTEIAPVGLTITALAGTNWTCTFATLICTRTDALAAGANYPELITVTATVAVGAPSSFVNSSTVALTGQTESNTNNNTGNAPATTVSTAPGLSKVFAPNPVGVGQISVLTFTITNGANDPVQSGLGFTDTLPANLVLSAVPATPQCGGTVTGVIGGSTITLAGGSIAAGTPACTVTVQVKSNVPGSYLNSTANGNIGGLSGGLSATGLAATLDVLGTALTKAFSPAVMASGQVSALTFTITNGTGNPAQVGLAFTDTLPAGLTVSGAIITPQCGGTVSSPAAGVVAFTGGALALGAASCTITVNVTGTIVAVYTNDSAKISGASTGMNTSGVNATLTIAAAPNLALTKTHSGDFVVGGTHAYTLMVNNLLGTAPTTGTITVTDTLPNGLTYASFSGTGWSCGAVGQVVTCTSTNVINAGATSANPIVLNVSVAAVAQPSVTNAATVSGGGEAAGTTSDNSAFDYTLVVLAATNSLLNDGAQFATAGSSVVYAHQFNAGIAGSVSFSTLSAPSPAMAGWSNVIYRDSNCNGVLDGTESATVLAAAVPVAAGAQVCIIVKEFVPAGAPNGAQDLITVTAAFTPSVGAPQNYTRTDVTTVGTAATLGLTLSKDVRNVTTGGAFGFSNSALPGEMLEYRITYTNVGTSPLSNVIVNDATPTYTTFVSATCGALVPNITLCNVTTQPAIGGSGSLVWTLTGSLAPGPQGTVFFRVNVVP